MGTQDEDVFEEDMMEVDDEPIQEGFIARKTEVV